METLPMTRNPLDQTDRRRNSQLVLNEAVCFKADISGAECSRMTRMLRESHVHGMLNSMGTYSKVPSALVRQRDLDLGSIATACPPAFRILQALCRGKGPILTKDKHRYLRLKLQCPPGTAREGTAEF